MTLDEIRVLLRFKDAPTENCLKSTSFWTSTSAMWQQRIRELRQLERNSKSLRETCLGGQDAEHCGILHELTEIAKNPEKLLVAIKSTPVRKIYLLTVRVIQKQRRLRHRPQQ
jgi:hypothetical protein